VIAKPNSTNKKYFRLLPAKRSRGVWLLVVIIFTHNWKLILSKAILLQLGDRLIGWIAIIRASFVQQHFTSSRVKTHILVVNAL
jgi:hypothetical protein